LFVNRNHQGLFLALMFPMLASAASMARPAARVGRRSASRGLFLPLLAAACGLCLVPLLLITGSRAGLLLGLVAILTVPVLILGQASSPGWLKRLRSAVPGVDRHRPESRLGATLAAVLTLAVPVAVSGIVLGAAYLSGRTEAFDRLRSSSIADDLRLRALPTIWSMIGHYWPAGSGAGTFEKAYFVAEPDGLLGAVFMNHAHNDWLEVVITCGFAGLALLVAAVAAFAWRAYQTVSARVQMPEDRSKSTQFVWLGLVVILLCALASLSDYPLRVPSLACVFVVAALWADCRLPLRRAAGSVASDGK
jgi:O-antigen ligase